MRRLSGISGELDVEGSGGGRARRARLLVAVVALTLSSTAFVGQASAQYTTPPPPQTGVKADTQTRPVVDASAVNRSRPAAQASAAGASRQARSGGQGLPVTGGDVLGLTAIGVGAVATGGFMLRLRRRATRT